MTWPEFYLICFLAGFSLSVISLVAGGVHLHFPHVHGLHFFHIHGGHGAGASPLNIATFSAFLAWFGGTGFLLSRYYGVWYVVALAVSFASGLGAAAIVFWFLFKILLAREQDLDPADYDMVGVLAKTTLPIRAGGTGEIVFSQAGTRHVAGARSEDGVPIPRGAEVVVTHYEKGIAYVKRWEDLAGEPLEGKEHL